MVVVHEVVGPDATLMTEGVHAVVHVVDVGALYVSVNVHVVEDVGVGPIT